MFLHKVNVDLLYLPPQLISPDGEIGRRTAFRWQRSKGCAGSNPVLGTKAEQCFSFLFNLLVCFLCMQLKVLTETTFMLA